MNSKHNYTRHSVAVLSAVLFALLMMSASSALAQTTTFTYQGRFTDTTVNQPTNGTYDFQFTLYDETGTAINGAVIVRDDVEVTNGAFTVQLDFGAGSFPGANRSLEIAVRAGASNGAYTSLTPRQPITSTPYAIRSLSAATADNAASLGGTTAGNFVQTNDPRLSDARTPTAGSANYIQNTTTQQTADFSITGGGTVGGRLTAGGVNITTPTNDKAIEIAAGRIILSYATVTGGTTSADAGTIPNTAAVIEISDNGAGGAGATATLPLAAENGTVIVIGTSDADGAVVFGVSGGASYAFNANQSARFTRIAGTWKFIGQ